MKLLREISKRRKGVNRLILALFSISIFLLQRGEPLHVSYPRQVVHIGVNWSESPQELPGFFNKKLVFRQVRTFSAAKSSEFLILHAISEILGRDIITAFHFTRHLLRFSILKTTEHFRSRSLLSEDPAPSIS